MGNENRALAGQYVEMRRVKVAVLERREVQVTANNRGDCFYC